MRGSPRAATGSLIALGLLLSYGGCGSSSGEETAPEEAHKAPVCPYDGETPFLDVEAFVECPATACPAIPTGPRKAHCLPNAAINSLGDDPSILSQLAPCDETSRCVPDLFAGYMLTKLPKTCRSLRGPDGNPVEGRCLSRCLTQVQEMSSMLPATSDGACDDATEACAPCFDPRNGAPLPSCTLGVGPNGGTCDTPKEKVTSWQRCCNKGGTCLPIEVIPEAQAATLGQKECPDSYKCAPQVAVDDPTWKPRECRTGGGPLGIFSPDGRCVPDCAIDTTGIGGVLKTLTLTRGVDEEGFTVCAEDEKCAPCENLGSDTGACF